MMDVSCGLFSQFWLIQSTVSCGLFSQFWLIQSTNAMEMTNSSGTYS